MKVSHLFSHCALTFTALVVGTYAEGSDNNKVDAQKIMEAAEQIRNPQDNYSVAVELKDKKDGKEETRTYETFIRGREEALVKFVTPASESGSRVLMVGPDMWVFIPTASKPVRVSANQRLTGNAAYGDVARLSFIGNYTAKVMGEEKINGQAAYHLELRSIEGRPVTYDVVEYWVDKKSNRPIKTHFKTSTGKLIREGLYENFKEVLGVQRPTTFVLINSLKKDHVTTLIFSNTKKTTSPAAMFKRENLGKY